MFLLKTSLLAATGYYILQYLDLDLDEEEKAAVAKKEANDGNTEGDEKEQPEGEVQIPDEMPEDAFFIPLGLTRQRPQEFYKGDDPEWQSFIEFRKDPERENMIRSRYFMTCY